MLSKTQAKSFTRSTADKPRLQIGSRGEAVARLQRILAYWGTYRGELDGEFDKLVEAAVKRFQFAVFLEDDGIVDSLTWEALEKGAPVRTPVLKIGSTGEWVTTVQTVLKEGGFYHGKIDGIFGKITALAVRALQKSFDLIQDGVVGTRTWWALSRIPRVYLPE